MTVYQWLCLLGVPALIAGGFKYLYSSLKKNTADTEAVKIGIQALLRSQMIADYNKWTDRGYAPIYARDNFENCWKQYHALGVNGVMDDLHEKFLELPTEPPEE
ncbi:hypothetical protein AALA54_17415 [Oscillospiraceae bacterium 44-34]|jgi:hypothetical protein|nr:hypothetical protein D7X33_08395 [Butyricicoccus sp. 1XD8-22]